MNDEKMNEEIPVQVPTEMDVPSICQPGKESTETSLPEEATPLPEGGDENDDDNTADSQNDGFERGANKNKEDSNDSNETMRLQLSDIQSIVAGETEKLILKMDELQSAFDSKLRYDEKKQAIIDRQAAELETFKKGLLEKSTLAFAQDLIAEVDSAEKLARYYESAEGTEDNFRKLKKALKDVSLSLCDILEKYGILSYRTKPGVTFDPRRQRARLTTRTGDKALDKTVKTLLGAGFEQERDDGASTKVLRPELVDVYVFDPSLVPAPETESAPTESAETEKPKPESAPAQNADADAPEPVAEAN